VPAVKAACSLSTKRGMADRKVYLEGEATVMLPVRVKFFMTIRADYDANITKAVKRASQGKEYAKADVEDLDVDEILEVGGYDGSDELDAAVQGALDLALIFGHGTFMVHKTEVISK